MLKKSNKNSGMSLIEVIVSMLVLSIAVVAVTMSFSTASKINMGSKTKQNVESLMENLMEYTEAGGTDYKTWFHATSDQVLANTATQKKVLYKGIGQGLYTYDVRVLTDTAPTTEYDTINKKDVIQFGSASSNTIMIDAGLVSNNNYSNSEISSSVVADQDEKAYETFYAYHRMAVLEANAAGAVPPLTETALNQIPNYVDRELRLEITTPSANKMQLTAYFHYELDSSILLSAGTANTLESTPLFTSVSYDVASAPDDGTSKLNQIYIMYSPAALEPVGYSLGQDIRVMDPAHAMNATIFIANQQTSPMDVDIAIGKNTVEERDTSTHTVYVSARNPETGAADMYPAGGDVYCSGRLSLQDFHSTTVAHEKELVAKGKDVRVVKTTLDILEAGTDKVLASKSVTHLQ